MDTPEKKDLDPDSALPQDGGAGTETAVDSGAEVASGAATAPRPEKAPAAEGVAPGDEQTSHLESSAVTGASLDGVVAAAGADDAQSKTDEFDLTADTELGAESASPSAPKMDDLCAESPTHARERLKDRHLGLSSLLLQSFIHDAVASIIGIILLAVVTFFSLQGELSDVFIWARGQAPISDKVALLSIGDEALYLWNPANPKPKTTSRELLAKLVDFLAAAGARVVVLDVLLETPTADDLELAVAAKRHGTVIAAERFRLSEPSSGQEFQAGLPYVFDGAIAGGFSNLQTEQRILFSDQTLVRAAPLVRSVQWAQIHNQPWPAGRSSNPGIEMIVPSLSLAAVWFHQQRSAGMDGTVTELSARLVRKLRKLCVGHPIRCSGGTQALGLPPTNGPLERTIAINFRGEETNSKITTIKAADVLRMILQRDLFNAGGIESPIPVPETMKASLEGRIVIVGRGDENARDRHMTPYSFPSMLQADMAGFRIQGQLVDQLVQGKHLRTMPPTWLSVLLGIGLGLLVLASYARVEALWHFLLWALGLALTVLFCWLVFVWTDGLVIDLSPALVIAAGTLLGINCWEWSQRERRLR